MKKFDFIGANNDKLNATMYGENLKDPCAVVVLVHGMQEHFGRYKKFGEFFVSKNIVLVGMDLRGHGEHIVDDVPGFCKTDIFTTIVEDYKILVNKLNKEYKNATIVVLGHSFGSFITQRLLTECDNVVDKFVICGSRYCGGFDFAFGKFFTKYIMRADKNPKKSAKFIENIMFGGYQKKFKTDNGNWLSRDTRVWIDYNDDKLCGQPFCASFYLSLFSNAPKNYKKLSLVDESTPILLISGSEDPVGGKNASLVNKLYKLYKKHWFNVDLKIYNNARHELLNETNNSQVYKDIVDFILANNKSAVNRK